MPIDKAGLIPSLIWISFIPLIPASITMPSASKLVEQKSEDEVEEIDNTLNDVENIKFAAITAAVSDVLLDDETSPPNSMMSSFDSEAKCKTTKKIINDSIKEKDLDDISPTFDMASPVSHGTPTHASHSFSLSDGDGGRDFLIDDEIADQPDLCIGDDHGKCKYLIRVSTTCGNLFSNRNIEWIAYLQREAWANICIRLLIHQLSWNQPNQFRKWYRIIIRMRRRRNHASQSFHVLIRWTHCRHANRFARTIWWLTSNAIAALIQWIGKLLQHAFQISALKKQNLHRLQNIAFESQWQRHRHPFDGRAILFERGRAEEQRHIQRMERTNESSARQQPR